MRAATAIAFVAGGVLPAACTNRGGAVDTGPFFELQPGFEERLVCKTGCVDVSFGASDCEPNTISLVFSDYDSDVVWEAYDSGGVAERSFELPRDNIWLKVAVGTAVTPACTDSFSDGAQRVYSAIAGLAEVRVENCGSGSSGPCLRGTLELTDVVFESEGDEVLLPAFAIEDVEVGQKVP